MTTSKNVAYKTSFKKLADVVVFFLFYMDCLSLEKIPQN
jgi:hypothetical protein